MASPLLVTSESFRKKLIVRNLVPYPKSPSKVSPPIDYDAPISDYSVTDSPDILIDEPGFSKELYKVNQYGADGGYKQVPDPTALLGSKSNEGEYGVQDARLIDEGYQEARKYRPVNAYADGLNIIDSAEAFSSLETIQRDGNRLPNGQPYYPLQFVPSRYRNVSILLSQDPQGSDGLLSQDSYIARLGADLLRKEFEQRIAAEIRLNTIGRINAFNVRGGTDILSLATGRVPIIEPNYRITTLANPILAATDFALRLAGTIIPLSPIPGSYFDPSINSGQPVTIQQLNNAYRRSGFGKFVSSLLGTNRSGSQLFLDNTGGGQKSRLFGNLDYNRYKPGYTRTVFDRLAGALVGTSENNSNYYIGSVSSEPSRVFSPSGDLPVNSFGQEQQSPVYGPSELAQLYEGPSRQVRIGANGKPYVDGGGIEGGLTWISPGTLPNAGKKVKPGGDTSASEEVQTQSSFATTVSTSIEFKDGSIMYDTQKLIDSAPKSGGRRLQHVGNAIDQVSKVFNDGYKEMTKGSKVIKYTGAIGVEQGVEYCRVFSKDLPYMQYNDLQKSDGTTTQNRKIVSSVLDNTYNLNIYPNKKTGTANSTNIVGDPDKDGYAKKYMFSIENLAWRTSSKPGFTWADLPICERGPNGGRVMWFPPYGLTFSESSNATWKDSSFIGRPEPIYTYSNTSRTGSLTWKIVVDHPSVLNLIVNKVLNSENDRERINSKIDSFFAGCLKYDLYELAKQYPLANPNDLFIIQKELDYRQVTKEQAEWIKRGLQTGSESTSDATQPKKENPQLSSQNITVSFEGLGFYFDNNAPKVGTTVSDYSTYYNSYITSKSQIVSNAPTTEDPINSPQLVESFFSGTIQKNFTQINDNLIKIYEAANAKTIEKVVFKLVASASSLGTTSNNTLLSKNRYRSVEEYIKNFRIGNGETLVKLLGNSLIFDADERGENTAIVKKNNLFSEPYTCSDADLDKPTNEINTVRAMACRRVLISRVDIKYKQGDNPQAPTQQVLTSQEGRIQTLPETTTTEPTEVTRRGFRDNITKRVLRLMMSECDYFDSIKEDTPMVYDNLKEKLKFFNPAFHSTTPEGLNSRLTFLQQCMRPGETIPVVKTIEGKQTLQYNNAVNTAFGAPPVLVLRVGDFYNTQIIPDGLQINYENLDLNPEGIGIQPMIANVTLTFKFVGGSGIKEAVDRIQNALSFNFYANTEIYDDRAEVTDLSLDEYDKEFKALYSELFPPTTAQVQNNNGQNNNSFIGQSLSQVVTESGTTGEILYTPFMSSFVDETQTYFNTIYNKNREILNQYNEGVRQIWTYDRGYYKGIITPTNTQDTYFFGKPLTYQTNFNQIFSNYSNQVLTNSDQFIYYIQNNKDISVKAQRQIQQNYLNVLTNKKNSFVNSISKVLQEIVVLEQKYLKDLQRLLIITFGTESGGILQTGTDGFQNEKGNTSPFYISGDSLSTMVDNKTKIKESLKNFNTIIESQINFTASNGKNMTNTLVQSPSKKFSEDTPFTPISQNSAFSDLNFKYQYIVLSQEITDDKKYQEFKNDMIGNVLTNPSLMENSNPNLEKVFDEYWIGVCKPIFTEENKFASEFMDSIGRQELKDYLNYTTINKTTELKLKYSNVSGTTEDNLIESRNDYIVSLANSSNSNNNNQTFNDEVVGPSVNIYISKSKLN